MPPKSGDITTVSAFTFSGIKLETLFIDEGFGSLDPDALQLAIKTLIDLQASGRTMGLISPYFN